MLLFFRILGLLPLRVLHALGAMLGWVVYRISPGYRRRLRENLPRDLPDRRRTLARAVTEAGKQALELAWVWTRPREDLLARVETENPEVVEAILAQDRAVLMLTPHLGCFEAIAQSYMWSPTGRRRPMLALYRVPRKAVLRPLFELARKRSGLLLAPADLHGVRLMLRALRNRQVVGLLPDQVPSRGEGVWAPFFGRPAYTMTLPARLAIANDAVVVSVVALRRPRGAGFRLRWEPLTETLTGDPAQDAAALNREMERLIRRCPEQYLWSYNRYKVPAGVEPPLP
ncbi:uncharacterized protein E1O_26780 [Burkholderiales bacterium GJ-E10]|nr:uncharacterized protein E1O_26780 [Burkholderiales bacterium GJ-E10]